MRIRILGIVFSMLLISATLTACGELSERTAPDIFPGLTPYKVQMHLHGHSNHNEGFKAASMEWHSVEARLTGTADVLWWTDHTEVFDQSRDLVVDFSNGILDPDTLDITELTAAEHIRAVTWLDASITGGSPTVSLGSAGLSLELRSDPGSAWQELAYELKGNHRTGLVGGFRLPRPVSSGAVLELELMPTELPEDAFYEVVIWLAWHHDPSAVQHHLVYRIVPDIEAPEYEIVSGASLRIIVPWEPLGSYSFDLLSDAALLENGDDNTISRIALGVGARNGATVSATIRSMRITSTRPDPLDQLKAMTELGDRYEQILNLQEHVGMEYGGGQGPHLNAFFPNSANLGREHLIAAHRIDTDTWIARVHDDGALISLNHPFGVSSGPSSLVNIDEREMRLAESARRLVANRAHGADLLEVGYLARGGLAIEEHLALWDILTANEVFLIGTGVSDSHQGRWFVDMQPNAFVTWIYATSREEADLLGGLASGHAFFGNPFLWDGRFSFRVGEHVMGQRVAVDDELLPLAVKLDPWPHDLSVELVQGIIEHGQVVSYLHRRTQVVPGSQLMIDVSRPGFVRLEVYRDRLFHARQPILFSNMIVFLDVVP